MVLPPPALPVDAHLDALVDALTGAPSAVLVAPPGAGKTTRVPLALLHAPWRGDRRIIVLEPRRIAARAAAARMAATLREPVGTTVGHRMRLDTKVSARTRVEVVTEGVLARMLLDDPSLDGVAAVVFDEFHERSLDADVGLALCLEAQRVLRPELRILVMSATLDAGAVRALLAHDGTTPSTVPLLVTEVPVHPVDIRYEPPVPGTSLPDAVAAAVRRALDAGSTGVLAFLPGLGEIRAAARRLERHDAPAATDVVSLHGSLDPALQERALAPAPPGRRKVVLATSVAQTSLTVEGIDTVVDGGAVRTSTFDPGRGMARLTTRPVSQATAAQRTGRAGRLGPGTSIRLWSAAAHRALPAADPPEIAEADLAPLALLLAAWGHADPSALALLDPPPPDGFAAARHLLTRLGALGPDGRITDHGIAMAGLAVHPRLAHLLLVAARQGHAARRRAAAIAALLEERDVLAPGESRPPADLAVRVSIVEGGHATASVDGTALARVRKTGHRWAAAVAAATDPATDGGTDDVPSVGALLALAYPERIARRLPDDAAAYELPGGLVVRLPDGDPLAGTPLLVCADLDADRRRGRIWLAAPVTLDAVADRLATADEVRWDGDALVARRVQRLGDLVVAETQLRDPPPEAVTGALVDAVRTHGLSVLPFDGAAVALLARLRFVAAVPGGPPAGWPDLSDEGLLATLDRWLAPFLPRKPSPRAFAAVRVADALGRLLDHQQRRLLDVWAPTHLTVPTGSRVPVDYATGRPVLAVRLQELFGRADTPRVADGRVAVVLHLLSPAGRPLQVTSDLAGFWAGSYAQVRAEMRGRYPRHPWPDDPRIAEPTRRATPRRQR